MKVSGFSFVKNAIKYGYPLKESILSILPLVDEYIIACGDSEDDTTELVRSIDSNKIKIIETVWDENLRKEGKVYSEQTNLALKECSGDICFYLQADEVIHEADYKEIKDSIKNLYEHKTADAVLFQYVHFYGDYYHIGIGRQWYRREVRVFKNTGKVVSWGDAQGFRIAEGNSFRKPFAIESKAKIFHYGWVRPPKRQYMKMSDTTKYYGGNEYNTTEETAEDFLYDSVYEVKRFTKTHPKLMYEKITQDAEWTRKILIKEKPKPFLVWFTDMIEKISGYRIGEYKDFKVIK